MKTLAASRRSRQGCNADAGAASGSSAILQRVYSVYGTHLSRLFEKALPCLCDCLEACHRTWFHYGTVLVLHAETIQESRPFLIISF
jgi:hypothetical protein